MGDTAVNTIQLDQHMQVPTGNWKYPPHLRW